MILIVNNMVVSFACYRFKRFFNLSDKEIEQKPLKNFISLKGIEQVKGFMTRHTIGDTHYTELEFCFKGRLLENHKFEITKITDDILLLRGTGNRLEIDYRAILNSIPDTYIRICDNGDIGIVSNSMSRLLGYDPEELIGQNISTILMEPEIKDEILNDILKAAGSMREIELKLKKKGKSSILALATLSAGVKNSSGTGNFIEGTLRDITKEKVREQKLKKLGRIDSLTSLYNRYYFLKRSREELRRAIRYRRDLSFLMIDIDKFKSINDKFGHHGGDIALKVFAKRSTATLRSSDIIGRLGGEEFGALLPETDLESARIIAERLRIKIQKSRIRSPKGTITMTASIGVTSLKDKDNSLDDLANRADEALYIAKRNGRNRVESV